ncbi:MULTISPECIES: isoprenyl transferase [Veillonella]|uniref:Isoprenyl transferase n=1 Tax=Veillonella denticariosi JCM 15641 TaxID=1298594 RepID=A0A2S7Z701_9FIRM|nr:MULTISPECIES: isoprenyl transferase [Veillonella]ETS93595.1 di-trans,poly-cis-decaprenylcistransferase [Veillonella sp. AS16]PQL19056.1 isoprenyl transferase [Veillonella denticariosi JCM 15641]
MLKKIFNRNQPSTSDIDNNAIPKHVAIIMDGNGRWAKRRGMPRSMGHKAGADVLKQIVIAADELGIKALTVYGFSTENWKRPEQEVSLLMSLIKEYLNKNVKYMHEHNVRIRFIGFIGGLSQELQSIIEDAEQLTKNNTGLTLQLAINYGGRDEIVRTICDISESVANGSIRIDDITENYVSEHLFTKEFSDVDLLIRPSGDFRISNFLLWQIAYAEFWFTDLHWPDFTKDTLIEAVIAYQKRERRFGGLYEE